MEVANSVDVIIVGGGPAGMASALWCDELGLRSVLIEGAARVGGQLHHVYNAIENYPGRRADDGMEMLSSFEASLASRNFISRVGSKASAIDAESMEVRLGTPTTDEVWIGGAIILAMGVRRRTLGVPGEMEFGGRGILGSGIRDKGQAKGKRVVIIGGGDAAFENAISLSHTAASVAVAFRKSNPSARDEFVKAAQQCDNIELLPETVVTEISGDGVVERIGLSSSSGGEKLVPADAVLIRIGVEPNSELVRSVVEVDEAGYIKVDHVGRTSAKNVYAVGDIANRLSPTLSTAVGTAASAAKAISSSMTPPRR
jgi:thioredoxin reductase (NADPH)